MRLAIVRRIISLLSGPFSAYPGPALDTINTIIREGRSDGRDN